MDRGESTITAGPALGGLEETIQGLQEAIGGAGLGPRPDAFEVGSHEAGHGLHGQDLGAADVRTP